MDTLSISDEVKQIIRTDRIGTIGSLRARNVITSHTIAALQYFIYGKRSDLLSGPSVVYPDRIFVF